MDHGVPMQKPFQSIFIITVASVMVFTTDLSGTAGIGVMDMDMEDIIPHIGV